MTPMFFHGHTNVIGAPEGWDHKAQGECDPLPVQAHDGGLLSVWKPSAEELAVLVKGGGITINLGTFAQPVMGVGVCAPECLLVSV